ncbi:hypothetical protein [Leptospirillum ferriphilum]|uniref:Uncharacterized protein n=1 Tax=Leptospirillum ferriphilum (strain ML-04) TaxID=1048260 RepID=J9ZDG0_LEPFM|nr:hypothetical protein [Leptospirillum ferriphilum]AFS54439.1 hypothetical protein LFML04_2248 [Leptospirillum ferriphilum ML-04]OOH82408.1 hypothetical protein BOX30_02800 [Leptospirillum ferriphilum]
MPKTVVKRISHISRSLVAILGICLLSGFMVKSPSGHKKLQILPLPPEYSPARSDLFAAHGARSFFFFNPQKSTDLWELSLYRPMGSTHYLGESWTRIPLPDLRSIHQIQDMAYARGMIFLSGVDENRTPILRSYLLSPKNTGNSTQRVVAHTDFYPPSGGVPVRELFYDHRTRVLWLLYDNGQIQIGPHILALHRTLLTDSPAGYLLLPGRKKAVAGPLLLPRVRKVSADSSCFSCSLSIFQRKRSEENQILEHPVRLPGRVRSHMGIWPLGQRTALFRDKEAFACHIPDRDFPRKLHPCLRVPEINLPMATLLTGSWLVLLTAPDEKAFRHLIALNAAYIDNRIRQGAPLKPGFLDHLSIKDGMDYTLPQNAHVDGTFSVSTARQAIFIGSRHLYRLTLYDRSPAHRTPVPKKDVFEP